jgi:ABC-type antimicrobial peptide transport system permease subunit
VFWSSVDEHYFETFGVSILGGRSFLRTDSADSPKVAIVNSVFAEKYFQGKAIGKRIRINGPNGPFAEIVGVAVTGPYLSVAEPPTDFLFLPQSQEPRDRMTFLAVSAGDPEKMAGDLRQLVRSMDSNLPIISLRTMDNVFQQSAVSNFYLTNSIFGSAGVIGFGLALIGLYAVVAYQVATRTREIGIRVALGADQPRILKLVLREAVVMSILGVAAGLTLILAVGHGLTMGHPVPFSLGLHVLVPLALLLTTLIAASIPARRASRVDPLVALRQD